MIDTVLKKVGMGKWLLFKAPNGNGGIRAMVLTDDDKSTSVATQSVAANGTPLEDQKINVFEK